MATPRQHKKRQFDLDRHRSHDGKVEAHNTHMYPQQIATKEDLEGHFHGPLCVQNRHYIYHST